MLCCSDKALRKAAEQAVCAGMDCSWSPVESSGIHDWENATNNPLVIKYNYGITTHLSCYSLACNQEQHYCNIYYSQKYSEIYGSLERKALFGESIYKHYLAIKRVLSLRDQSSSSEAHLLDNFFRFFSPKWQKAHTLLEEIQTSTCQPSRCRQHYFPDARDIMKPLLMETEHSNKQWESVSSCRNQTLWCNCSVIISPWWKTSRGRPSPIVLSYGFGSASRQEC